MICGYWELKQQNWALHHNRMHHVQFDQNHTFSNFLSMNLSRWCHIFFHPHSTRSGSLELDGQLPIHFFMDICPPTIFCWSECILILPTHFWTIFMRLNEKVSDKTSCDFDFPVIPKIETIWVSWKWQYNFIYNSFAEMAQLWV